jgi:hypothetical protein
MQNTKLFFFKKKSFNFIIIMTIPITAVRSGNISAKWEYHQMQQGNPAPLYPNPLNKNKGNAK